MPNTCEQPGCQRTATHRVTNTVGGDQAFCAPHAAGAHAKELRLDADARIEALTRIMISPRIWSHFEGTQAWYDARGDQFDPAEYCHTLVRKIHDAPVTRKDGRFAVWLTAREMADLRHQVEAMREGAADNTWDEDGRADLFAANSLLAQLRKAGA